MHVINRKGEIESISFDKILFRLKDLCYNLNLNYVNIELISKKTIEGMYDGITTKELDELTSEISANMSTIHYDYNILAGRIIISNLHKETNDSFSETMKNIFIMINNDKKYIINQNILNIIDINKEFLDNIIIHNNDYSYDYFAIKTLLHNYLLKKDNKVLERPQYMLLRTALSIHTTNMENVQETYMYLTNKYYIHATPTLFNSCLEYQQLSSCFLLDIKEDSIDGIYETLKQTAIISKYSGGIGLSISNVRSKNSFIYGTNGYSNGILPMLRIFNNSSKYVDQGGNKRPGSLAIYIEPWHADIIDFLNAKKNIGIEEHRARDLFYGLWIPDLFMNRVENDEDWCLMCPNKSTGLQNVYGNEFNLLYNYYEKAGIYVKKIKARKLWELIVELQIETGMPYMLYKDSCNEKSNQKNLGVIKCSNLCTEIIQYTSIDEISVCNLASISLPSLYNSITQTINYEQLDKIIRLMTRNLNKIIDNNYYPLKETKNSNMKHRPIGIGVQGLADLFMLLKIDFDSDEAKTINIKLFENIYYSALSESCNLAKEYGHYESYENSPIHKNILQFDMWNIENNDIKWCNLRKDIIKYGVRNSLLIAAMPTASTAQILSNTESIEPITSNIYVRRVKSGDFIMINKYLLNDLIDLKLWNEDMRNKLISENGSIQNINNIPINIKKLYRTVWEMSQKSIIDMSVDRAPYIDQSQSLNIYLDKPNLSTISSVHFYGWKKGLKTGMYYLRTKPAVNPLQFTVDKKSSELYNKNCIMCSG